MPEKWQKQKVKYTKIDLEKFNRCLLLSHFRNRFSFNCYQWQNITTEYFHFSRFPSRAVYIFEMITQMISTG